MLDVGFDSLFGRAADDDDGRSENDTVFGSERFDVASLDFGAELSTIIDFVFTFSFDSFIS